MAESFGLIMPALPDESLYSLLCRLRALAGLPAPTRTARTFLGFDLYGLYEPMPTGLYATLARRDPFRAGDLNDLLERTTPLPLFSIWKQPGETPHQAGVPDARLLRYQSDRWALGQEDRKMRWFQFCADCVEEDRKAHGVAYWHRSHQIPAVAECHRHRIRLSRQTFLGRKGTAAPTLSLPAEALDRSRSRIDPVVDWTTFHHRRGTARKFAEFVYGFLNDPIDPASLDALRMSLRKTFLSKVSGQQQKLVWRYAEFMEAICDLGFPGFGCTLRSALGLTRYEGPFGPSAHGKAALCHLVTLAFMFRSYDHFRSCLEATNRRIGRQANPVASEGL